MVVLKILSFSLLFFPLPPVLGHALWAVNLERSVLRIVVVNFVARVFLGFVLIYGFGLIGAAVSVLACSGVNVLQHYLLYCQKVEKIGIVEGIVEVGSGHLAFIGVRDAPPLSQICHCDDGCDFVCIVDIQVCVSSVFTDPT